MNTCICAILRNENVYLQEWVDHHLNLGFDHIYLYDNNDINGENPMDIVKDYKNVYIDTRFRGMDDMYHQQDAYTIFYKTYGLNYDWIAYIDIDEYIQLEKYSIKQFLSQDIFTDCDCIRLSWKCYTDNDLIIVENNNYSIKRFTTPTTYQATLCKSIIRGNLNYINSISAHGSENIKKPMDANGDICDSGHKCPLRFLNENKKYVWTNAWINHYRYKTIQEFIDKKMEQWCSRKNIKVDCINLEDFFRINKKTKEKIEYIQKHIFENEKQ
jgi:hypothetical protein